MPSVREDKRLSIMILSLTFDEEDPHGTLEKIKAELHNRYPDYTQFAIVDTDF